MSNLLYPVDEKDRRIAELEAACAAKDEALEKLRTDFEVRRYMNVGRIIARALAPDAGKEVQRQLAEAKAACAAMREILTIIVGEGGNHFLRPLAFSPGEDGRSIADRAEAALAPDCGKAWTSWATALRELVNQQAKDEGLWFVGERTAPEAYLQAALRKLHALVESTTRPDPPPSRPLGG